MGETNLFLVMEAFVVVLQSKGALLLPGMVLPGSVHDVAAKEFLPEGEAPRRACKTFPVRDGGMIVNPKAYLHEDRIQRPY